MNQKRSTTDSRSELPLLILTTISPSGNTPASILLASIWVRKSSSLSPSSWAVLKGGEVWGGSCVKYKNTLRADFAGCLGVFKRLARGKRYIKHERGGTRTHNQWLKRTSKRCTSGSKSIYLANFYAILVGINSLEVSGSHLRNKMGIDF